MHTTNGNNKLLRPKRIYNCLFSTIYTRKIELKEIVFQKNADKVILPEENALTEYSNFMIDYKYDFKLELKFMPGSNKTRIMVLIEKVYLTNV